MLLLVDRGDLGVHDVADGEDLVGLRDAAVGDLGDVDQAVHTRHDLGEGAEGHQLHDAHSSDVADLVLALEALPGILVRVLVAQRDLVGVLVEVDHVHVDLVADRDDVRGLVDALPAQLGNVDHAVHAADVDERAVAGQALDDAVIALADLDLVPDAGDGLMAGLRGDLAD